MGINDTYGSSGQGKDTLAMSVDLRLSAAVGEDVAVSHLAQSQFAVVAVSTEILKTVKSLSQTSQSFTKVVLVSFPIGTAGVETTIVDTTGEAVANVPSACRPVATLIGDVILHASSRINLAFNRHDGSTKSFVVFRGIHAIGISQRVVDVLFSAVDTQSFGCHLEFLGGISKRHERQNPD